MNKEVEMPKKSSNRAVVVYSGGLDSTVLLTKCLKQYEEVVAINFNYGSKHNERERGSAHEVCKFLEVELVEVNLPFINDLFKSDLLQSGGDIPEGYYTAENMKKTVVPFRNGIMLSIAAGYTESIGFDIIAIANHAGDHTVYFDCREEFIEAMHTAIAHGTTQVGLYAPFTNMKKADIVLEGVRIKAPLELTWSCYEGKERPCLRCGTCQERTEAFYLNSLKDPILSEEEWREAVNILKEGHKYPNS